MQNLFASIPGHVFNLALSSNPIVPALFAIDNAVHLVARDILEVPLLDNPIIKILGAKALTTVLFQNPVNLPLAGALYATAKSVQSSFNFFGDSSHLSEKTGKISMVALASILTSGLLFSLSTGTGLTLSLSAIGATAFSFWMLDINTAEKISFVASSGIMTAGTIFTIAKGIGFPISFTASALAAGSLTYLLALSPLGKELREKNIATI